MIIDKPEGWILAPVTWIHTGRNLLLALISSINGGDRWARSRGLRFLRYVHRLDAETSGVLLFVKNAGAVAAYTRLFEERRVEKIYWAVVQGAPKENEWTCELPLGPHPRKEGRMRVDHRNGKEAQTHFRVLTRGQGKTLVEVQPITGRTHQIRVHLQAAGCPVLGDAWYGNEGDAEDVALALRAVRLSYCDPFTRRHVRAQASVEAFLAAQGWDASAVVSALPSGPGLVFNRRS